MTEKIQMGDWKKQEGAGIWLPENEGDKLEGEVTHIDNCNL